MTSHNSPEDLKAAVAFLRSLRGWDQQELAAAAGLSASSISRYESGDTVPSPRALEKIAVAVGLAPRTLNRLLLSIRSARTAAASAAHPDDLERRIEAIASEVCAGVSELLYAATALVLGSSLPDLPSGPWGATTTTPCAEDRRQAPALWEILRRRKPLERRVLVEDSRTFQSWALCELLCAESVRATAGGTGQALELAGLALRIAELVPGQESWRRRLQGYAWAHVGNARRVQGDLQGAAEAFARSARLWEDGKPGGPELLDEAPVLRLEVSVGS